MYVTMVEAKHKTGGRASGPFDYGLGVDPTIGFFLPTPS